MGYIAIGDEKYKVVENLGWQMTPGVYAKEVKTESGTKMAVKVPGGLWRFWTMTDILQPATRVRGQS